MKYSKQQIYQISAAVLFLIGAIFMLVNTFADQPWSFWTGLGFALAAAALYILMVVEHRKEISKKLTDPSYSDKKDNSIEHGKNVQSTKSKTPENKV